MSHRILQVAHVIEVVFILATLILLFASILLISNTIRLSIFSRRREIEVMKLVGATNWFVRGPFMLEGLLCGLAGSLLAVVFMLLGKAIALPAILAAPHRRRRRESPGLPADGPDPRRDGPQPRRDRLRPDDPPLPAHLTVPARLAAGTRVRQTPRPAVLGVAAAVVVAFAVGLLLHPIPARSGPSELQQVRDELAAHYYRRLTSSQLASPSIAKLIASLHDPYTAYLTPAEYQVARRAFAAGYGGVGITVAPGAHGLLVRRASVGPVHAKGVEPGDEIVDVNGVSTAKLGYREAAGRILGLPGTTVRLRIARNGRTFEVKLVRHEFQAHPVHAELDGKVGIIDVAAFVQGSAAETRAAVLRLRAEGAHAYVLDLRGNPGGLLDQGVGIASLFLRDGSTIVSLAGAHRPLRTYDSRGDLAVTAPLAVLVNRSSASASEVVAGALKDYARATIIGLPTFGKSLVQEIYRLPSGAALKLTVARYLTPAGYVISRGGIEPDIRSRHPVVAALHFFARRRN